MTRRTQVDELDRIPVRVPSPAEYERVAQVLELLAVDEADLSTLRQMFGFEHTPGTRRPRRHRVTHGTAAGVRWHDESQVPDCRSCGRYRYARTVHGTEQSCQAHYQDGTDLCEVCQEFYDARHSNTGMGRHRLPSGASCGTAAGYRRHIRLGERICADCRVAETQYGRQRKANARPQTPAAAAPISAGLLGEAA